MDILSRKSFVFSISTNVCCCDVDSEPCGHPAESQKCTTQSLRVRATQSPRVKLKALWPPSRVPEMYYPESTQSQPRVKPESQNSEPEPPSRVPESNYESNLQRVKQTSAAILIYFSWSVFNLSILCFLFQIKSQSNVDYNNIIILL